MLDPEGFLDPFANEVQHLTQAHQYAEGAGDHHEQGEDLLLRGTADEAVHSVGAGIQGALGQPDGPEYYYQQLPKTATESYRDTKTT